MRPYRRLPDRFDTPGALWVRGMLPVPPQQSVWFLLAFTTFTPENVPPMVPSLTTQKTTQALNFFAEREGGEIKRMKALKLLFFADRYHLRKFGRPLSCDRYYAMKNGPVASEAKDVTELVGLADITRQYVEQFLSPSSRHYFASLKEYDPSVFSESDRETLEFAWNRFGRYTEFELSEITHLYPEWSRHRDSISKDGKKRARMSHADFFMDPIGLADPCFKLSERDRALAQDIFREQAALESRWK